MAYEIQGNVERETAIKKKGMVKFKERIMSASPLVVEKSEQSVNFLILWTAVGWYYFFSGLTMLIRGKLPNGWKPLKEKQIVNVMSNVAEFTRKRKSEKRYGRIVDLDEEVPNVNLMH